MIELARTAARPRGSPIAHGRKSVRTQSAILDKTPTLCFVFIRTKNTIGARNAQLPCVATTH